MRHSRRTFIGAVTATAAAGWTAGKNPAAGAAMEKAEVFLGGKVKRPGSHQLDGDGPWKLKDVLGLAGGYDDKEERLAVLVYGKDTNGKEDFVAQVPLEYVIDDPDVIVYVKAGQTVQVIPRKGERRDPRGI